MRSQTKRRSAPNRSAACFAEDAARPGANFARGEIDQAALTRAADDAIKGALSLQERIGLKFATDGNSGRRSYHSFSTAS